MRKALPPAALALTLLTACMSGPVGNHAVPQPAKAVDLRAYAGRWYEYARYENRFERGCEGVTADYAPRDDGGVSVINTCRKGAPDGPAKVARGKAKVVEGSRGAKLKVSFFGPFWGDYWVLDHADDYSWSVVGEPSGRYLWVLTREPKPNAARATLLEQRVRELGYDWGLVRQTRQ
jgi:apolipoprotein D and lipocalin family protein